MRALWSIVVVSLGCAPPGAFHCDDDEQCVMSGAQGTCQQEGVCSFPDASCDSEQRYGEHGGALAGQCVPAVGGTQSTGDGATSGMSGSSATRGDDDGAATEPIVASDTNATSTADAGPATTSTSDPTDATDDDASTSTGQDATWSAALLLWLRFEDVAFAEGILDSGPLGLTASCPSDLTCPIAVAGWIGQGAQLDGATQCVIVDNHPELSALQALTVSAWVRPVEDVADNHMAVAKPVGTGNSNSFELYVFNADPDDGLVQLRMAVGNAIDGNTVTAPMLVPVEQWVHLAGTWDGETIGLWVDGELVASLPHQGIAVDDKPLLVGCDDDVGGDLYDNVLAGVIDEVRVFDGALTAEEIATLAR